MEKNMITSTKQEKIQSRRNFLKVSGIAAATAAANLWLPDHAYAEETISEPEAINKIVSGPLFRLPKFPLVGASVNMQESRFGNIQTLEYQQQGGRAIIDNRQKLYDLADQFSEIYTPGAINPNAFDKLVTLSGLSQEFAQNLKNNQNPSNLDVLAHFIFGYLSFRENYGSEWLAYKGRNGELKVIGSEDSIIDLKSDGKTRRPRKEARPLRDLLEALGGLVTGQGFKSADYNGDDVNRVPRKAISYMGQTSNVELPSGESRRYTPGISLSLPDTISVVEKYGNFPPQKMDIVWLSRGNKKQERRDFNVSGPVNGNAFELARLEEMLSSICIENRRRLTLGSPNKNMISPVSAGNQLSTTSELLGIDSYSPVSANNFFIHVMEKTGVSRNLRNYGTHHVTVVYGQDALKMVKMRRDRLFYISALENAGIGFAFGGPFGAALSGIKSAIDGIWGYFEGKNPPGKTLMSDNRHYVSGLEGAARDVFSIINNSHEIGANTLIVTEYTNDFCVTKRPAYMEPVLRQVLIQRPGFVQTQNGNMFFGAPGTYNLPQPCAPAACTPVECIPEACAPVCTPVQPVQTLENRTEWISHPAEIEYYKVPSVGVLYARDAYNIEIHGSCNQFDTTECGANHLLGLLYSGIMRASFNNPFENHNPGPGPTPTTGVTGGRGPTPSPTGDGFHGVSGSNPSAPTGNGYNHGLGIMGGR